MPKFRLPALNSLRVFEAVARLQSFTKGGDELHINNAAASRHIQKVEQQLGRELFDRHHRKIVLNEAGELLFRAVTMGFTQIQRAIQVLSGNRNPGRLVISVDPDFAGLWLVPRLAEFYALVPNTLVEILAEKNANTLQDPRIDCAIQYAEAGQELENGEVLFRSRLFPVCAPSVAQTSPLRSPEDLGRHVLLHDRTFDEWQEYVESCFPAIDIDASRGPVFSETAHCMEAAARGQGVAMGDDFLADLHLSEGRLVRPFNSEFLSKNAYYFIVSEAGANHPAVAAFRSWLFQGVDRVRNKRLHGARISVSRPATPQ